MNAYLMLGRTVSDTYERKMDIVSRFWFLLVLLLTVVCVAAITLKMDVHNLLQKREIDGFRDLKQGHVQFYTKVNGVHSRLGIKELHRRKRDTGYYDEDIELHIQTENKLIELELHKVTQPFIDTPNIVFRTRDFLRRSHIKVKDCFYTGIIKSDPFSVASVAICDHLEGAFTDGGSTYWFESLSLSEEAIDHEVIIGHRKDLFNIDDDGTIEPPYEITGEDPTFFDSVKDTDNENSRNKRSATTLTAETVVFVDEAYVNRLKALGFSTDAEFTEQILVRLHGMQAEWSKSDVLGYNMVIDIKLIEFWDTDPSWFSVSSNLQNTLSSVCSQAQAQGTYANYDTIHLFTGVDSPDVSGKAFTGQVCVDGLKCAVSTYTRATEFTIPAHEFGHVMNMSHDAPEGCPSPDDGIMGSKPTGWSTCSVSSMAIYLSGSSANCLTTTDVLSSAIVSLQPLWPGMIYTDDEICEYKLGPGYRFRYYPISLGECSLTSCIQMNSSASNYGTMVNDLFPTDGRYCDIGKVCLTEALNGAYQCITYAATGLNTSLITSITGGWSAWGSMTSCSRTCGTGVQYRQRFCNNPKPQNSPTCTGDEYELTLCNTNACPGDSTTETTLIQQRAGETCTTLINNGFFSSSEYQTTGDRFTSNSFGQCEVTCNPQAGFSVPTFQRFGLMPDGTPCSPDTQTLAEQYNLPITDGTSHHCVQGYCIGTGCDGIPGKMRDRCDVCGGTNSSCTVVDGIYTDAISGDTKIYTLPTGAFNIYFYFDNSVASMNVYFLEIWEGASTYILSYAFLGDTNTLSNPRSYAGTDWHFLIGAQYLWAEGPTDRSVDIYVTDFTGGSNIGINYGYSYGATNDTTTTGPTTTAGPTTTTNTIASPTTAPTTTASVTQTTASGTVAQTTPCATTSCSLSAIVEYSAPLMFSQLSTIFFIVHVID